MLLLVRYPFTGVRDSRAENVEPPAIEQLSSPNRKTKSKDPSRRHENWKA
jgi:hypothetical protein